MHVFRTKGLVRSRSLERCICWLLHNRLPCDSQLLAAQLNPRESIELHNPNPNPSLPKREEKGVKGSKRGCAWLTVSVPWMRILLCDPWCQWGREIRRAAARAAHCIAGREHVRAASCCCCRRLLQSEAHAAFKPPCHSFQSTISPSTTQSSSRLKLRKIAR